MKHTIIYIVSLLFFYGQFANAQNKSETHTVITTEDGYIYKGDIVSENTLEIVLKTVTVGEITIPSHLIKTRETKKGELTRPRQYKMVDRHHKTRGNFLTFDFTLSVGLSSLAQFNVIYGKRLTTRLNVGGGLAYSSLTNNNSILISSQQLVQPFAYGQYFWNTKRWRLFTDSKLGYGFDVTDANNFGLGDQSFGGGVYLNPGFGFEIANRRKVKWSIKLSQYIQKSAFSETFPDEFQQPFSIKSNIWYNRTALTIGITF